jgi:nickel-dependent lactate racemase
MFVRPGQNVSFVHKGNRPVMALIDLKYGRESLPFEYDPERFEILASSPHDRILSDADVGDAIDRPIGSPPLDELIGPGDSVLIVVPDATRQTASGQVINLLVRRLIANGTQSHDIRIIFATGIHRKVTTDEKGDILTPFVAQRIKTLDHDPRDLARLVNVGSTSGGIPVELNRALLEHDHILIVGGVTFHYFAGFTGGRKLICPGLASSRTISETHKLAFDCDRRARRAGVDTGELDGNAVHEAFVDAASHTRPAFAIHTIVDDDGNAVEIYSGDWIASHRAACDAYAARHTVHIAEKRDLVVVSCGGYPFDINMIQAHKALDAAARACNEGGTIVFLAECPEGLGRDDFLKWFDAENSRALAELLCSKYQVNGQTAWSLLHKAERFAVKVMTRLPQPVTGKMRLDRIDSVSDVGKGKGPAGYLIPNGAKVLIKLK